MAENDQGAVALSDIEAGADMLLRFLPEGTEQARKRKQAAKHGIIGAALLVDSIFDAAIDTDD